MDEAAWTHRGMHDRTTHPGTGIGDSDERSWRPREFQHILPMKHAGWINVPRGIVWMLVGLAIAIVFTIIRNIYRTIELTDGWNGTIISTEKWFNWFDGAPIVVATFTFNVFHPGYFLRDLESENRLPASKN
ncbi:hypothetical protein FRC11_002925 [Ceratobasidium sp. 423]|nr:hypothetical protein FRC11_002925 [Ceratobasidium sp. 423]